MGIVWEEEQNQSPVFWGYRQLYEWTLCSTVFKQRNVDDRYKYAGDHNRADGHKMKYKDFCTEMIMPWTVIQLSWRKDRESFWAYIASASLNVSHVRNI